MDRPDDTSKPRSGRNKDADVSAETSPRTPLQQRIEAQRAQLLHAHAVLRCLHDALLYAADDDALLYAEAAHVAAKLVNNTAEELDSVHVAPLIEA